MIGSLTPTILLPRPTPRPTMKVSIRLFDDREVRAVWDDEHAKWWFSVVDVVGVLNEEPDYIKAGNYWRWLKRKLIKEGVQFVSGTHRLKLTAADGKHNSLFPKP